MSATPAWEIWLIAIPLGAAVVSALVGRRATQVLAAAVAVGVPVAAAGLARGVWRAGPRRYALGGWDAPLGIELRADGLAVLMLGVAAVVGAASTVYATGYFREREERSFWPLWFFLWAALNALFLAADVFNLYITLELLALAAVGLVAHDTTREASVAGMRYLLISLLGSLLFLLGVALLYGAFGTVSLSHLADLVIPGPLAALALAVMTLGLLMKTALFPLHGWLPPAHASAPAPASAALSGLVVKAAFYVVLRLWIEVFPVAPGDDGAGGSHLAVGTLGAGAILWGSVLALRQRGLKLLVAYSTVGQLGYLFLLFPLLAGGWGETAWHGGIYHAASHACSKAAMFLAAGNIVHATGDDGVARLSAIGHRLPISFSAFGIGGLSLSGIPPSGGFVAKWLLLSAAIGSGRWVWAAIIAVGSFLTVAYVFVVVHHAFERGDGEARSLQPVPLRMEVAALSLALLSVLLGIWAVPPLALLGIGGAAPGP